ncbi:2-succinylbenzoate--CoA ligase [Myxosarcina sp. GI1(2024)]
MTEEILECLQKCSASKWLGDRDSQKLDCLIGERLTELLELTAKNQDRIKVFIVETNYLKFIAAFIACIVAKVEIFLCNPNWKTGEWQQVLDLVQPALILGDKLTQQLIKKILPLANNSKTLFIKNYALIMIPTGGSSGKIRFTMHTMSNLTASVRGFSQYFQDKTINSCCILPLFHVSGLMQLMRSLLTNGKLLILNYETLKQTSKPKLDKTNFFISLVPTQLQFFIDTDPLWLSEFKTVLIGGAPVARLLLAKARSYNIPLALTYGMTETASQIVTLKPQDFLQGNNSSGKVLPHAKITIESDRKNLISEKKLGLIKIKAESLCLGYYPQLFVGSKKFTTDDLGWFDPAGYLHVVGRNSHKIITGGENVFPSEVEAAIIDTELVTDVCVIGLPDSYWGQVVTAVYVPKQSPINLNLIRQHLQATLSNYKHPKHWLEVNNLPRNNRGKIEYREVKLLARKLIANFKNSGGL